MNETIACPGCEAQLALPILPEEQQVQCPRCKHVFESSWQRTLDIAARPATREVADEEAMPRRPLRSEPLVGQWKALAAMLAIGLSVASFGVQMVLKYETIEVVHLERILVFDRNAGILQIAEFNERADRIESWVGIAQFIHHAIFWPGVVFFLVWYYRAHKNLRLLQADTHFTPGWSVASFFIPISQLFLPLMTFHVLWRASNPNAIRTPRSWQEGPSALRVWLWWGFFLAFGVLEFFASRNNDSDVFNGPFGGGLFGNFRDFRAEITALWIHIAGNMCAIVAGILLISLIASVMRMQTQRYERLYEDPE